MLEIEKKTVSSDDKGFPVLTSNKPSELIPDLHQREREKKISGDIKRDFIGKEIVLNLTRQNLAICLYSADAIHHKAINHSGTYREKSPY